MINLYYKDETEPGALKWVKHIKQVMGKSVMAWTNGAGAFWVSCNNGDEELIRRLARGLTETNKEDYDEI